MVPSVASAVFAAVAIPCPHCQAAAGNCCPSDRQTSFFQNTDGIRIHTVRLDHYLAVQRRLYVRRTRIHTFAAVFIGHVIALTALISAGIGYGALLTADSGEYLAALILAASAVLFGSLAWRAYRQVLR